MPKWPDFDSSVKFNETDPTYVDGHVRALAWRKVWQAIKEHFEAARDEYAHSLYNCIMKVRVSTLDKAEAEDAGHLFYDAASGNGDAVINPLDPDKAVHVNANVERAAHADRVHHMVVHTFTEFLNMMIIEKAHNAKHSGEYVRWRPEPYSHTWQCARFVRPSLPEAAVRPQLPSWTVSFQSHTEANNVHAGPYGIVQKRAQYFQLLGLDSMHIMIVKELESQLAIVLKKVVQTPELKTTVSNQASEVHTAVPAKGSTYDDNTDRDDGPADHGRGRHADQLHFLGTRYGCSACARSALRCQRPILGHHAPRQGWSRRRRLDVSRVELAGCGRLRHRGPPVLHSARWYARSRRDGPGQGLS